MTEEWIEVNGFPEYEVSFEGRFRRIAGGQGAKIGRILKWHLCVSTAYPTIRFVRDGRQFNRCVHQVVAMAFHGPRPEGMQVRHFDGDTLNCSAKNLIYGTGFENGQDKVRHGRSSAGEKNPKAKLTEEGAEKVRSAKLAGESAKSIAMRFGLNPSTVHRIATGKYWNQEASNRNQDRSMR